MDFNNQKLLKGKNDSSVGQAEDRISELPDAILYHILSFLDNIKPVALTCILSKRWHYIWTSFPIFKFPFCDKYSLSETNKVMDFVDATLLHRDASSNIQKLSIETNEHFNAFRVRSWISHITKRYNVRELNLCLELDKPFSIPSSLFKCESLTKLELSAFSDIHIPKSFSFPKLKSLKLCGIRFTEDDGWNKQHFSNCAVLENLTLEDCTWSGMRTICILTPALNVLNIRFYSSDGQQDYNLKIYAPNLVCLSYCASVAKDYDVSRFVKLENAEIYFYAYHGEERIGNGLAVSKFLQAISHIRSLTIDAESLEAVLVAEDYVNILPTFHNLNKLDLIEGPATDEFIFALLKAAPNLKTLQFYEGVFSPKDDHNGDADRVLYDETEGLFQQLQSVKFRSTVLEGRELQWEKLILKNAKSLQTMTIAQNPSYYYENKEVVISELSCLARVSGKCLINFLKE